MMRQANDCQGPQLILWRVQRKRWSRSKIVFFYSDQGPLMSATGPGRRHVRPRATLASSSTSAWRETSSYTPKRVCALRLSNALSRAAALCLTTWILTLSGVGGRISLLRGPGTRVSLLSLRAFVWGGNVRRVFPQCVSSPCPVCFDLCNRILQLWPMQPPSLFTPSLSACSPLLSLSFSISALLPPPWHWSV